MRRTSLFALAALVAGASASASAGKVVRVEPAARREVFVPAGAFEMGLTIDERKEMWNLCGLDFDLPAPHSTTLCDRYDKEMQHMEARTVFVSAFWIDRDEVSVADYRACVAGGGCAPDPLVGGDERYLVPTWPIVNVTWSEAQSYCRWRGGRLPSEAEWERAARGDTSGTWPWGEVFRPTDFNHGQPRSTVERQLDRGGLQNIESYIGSSDASDGAEILAPVGSYVWGDGPYGTRDQAGNVAEWTADAYVFLINQDEGVKLAGYDTLSPIDPVRWGSIGDDRVVRGGSWRQPTEIGRTNVRDPMQALIHADHRYPYIGLRCVRPTH